MGDGGDCCGSESSYNYCDDCVCLDCNFVASGDACVDAILGTCQTSNWQGDGYCDDGNNNAGCDWDGGDCCGASANYNYCSDCVCLDCTFESGDACVDSISGSCQTSSWQADGYCDDGNNNAGCDRDGGDCCGSDNNYNYCSGCLCLDCTFVDSGCSASCGHSSWTGDGYCDDDNNSCGCDWDEGDCCGDDNNYSYCSDCQCLDPAA